MRLDQREEWQAPLELRHVLHQRGLETRVEVVIFKLLQSPPVRGNSVSERHSREGTKSKYSAVVDFLVDFPGICIMSFLLITLNKNTLVTLVFKKFLKGTNSFLNN